MQNAVSFIILLIVSAIGLNAQSIIIDRSAKGNPSVTRGFMSAHLAGKCLVSDSPVGARMTQTGSGRWQSATGMAGNHDPMEMGIGNLLFFLDNVESISGVIRRNELRPEKSIPYMRERLTANNHLVISSPFIKKGLKIYQGNETDLDSLIANETIIEQVRSNSKLAKPCGFK